MSNRGRQAAQVAADAYGGNTRYILISSFVVLLVLSCSVSAPLWAFQGSTGEPYDPYQIANVEQLLRLTDTRIDCPQVHSGTTSTALRSQVALSAEFLSRSFPL